MCNSDESGIRGRSLLQSIMSSRVKSQINANKFVQPSAPPREIQKEQAGLLNLRARGTGQQQPAGWFGGFSEHESTYTKDAEDMSASWPERRAAFPGKLIPGEGYAGMRGSEGQPAKWFEESPSGGPNAAWQTMYPALDELGHLSSGLNWKYTTDGRWQQMYEPPASALDPASSLRKSAEWFDTHVTNYDAYGRINEPSSRARRYINWEPKISHVKLNCKTPGCIANTTLQVYEAGRVAKCFMTFATHPTDFDDDHSEEVYEWISVNNANINTMCKPMATGCGPKKVSQTALYPCMHRQDISELLSNNNGTLHLGAKISDMVDECPLSDGSLLSAAAEIYCLLEQKEEQELKVKKKKKLGVNAYGVLQCTEPGCIANTTLWVDKSQAENLTCRMSINIKQTDYDQDLGSVEQVEWIQMAGKQIKTNCKPGKNPCRNATKLKDVVHDSYDCVSGLILSQDGNWSGEVNVSAKISPKVDECASQGFLLDGLVEIICRPDGDDADATTAAPAAVSMLSL